VSALLFNAFRALGPAASWREIATVAAALRESGDEETGRLLDYSRNNKENWDRCVAMAEEAGAHGFIALDLAIAVHNPARVARLLRNEAKVAD
jgi:hypothetical protein